MQVKLFFITRPGLAGAVLQTIPQLIPSCIHAQVKFHASHVMCHISFFLQSGVAF